MLKFRIIPRFVMITLLLGVVGFYASALNFGFIWDDPVWYGHMVGKSWLELIQPLPDFQFYRPGSMLYVRLFLQADGVFAAPLLHWSQMCWHLLNIALIYALSRRLGLGHWAAFTAATLVALYPFSYQAVAWAAPNQPMAAALQNGAWLAYLVARPSESGNRGHRQPVSRRVAYAPGIILFILALTVQESAVAMALLPLLFELLLRTEIRNWRSFVSIFRSPIARGLGQALVYPLVALVFGLLWLQAPRQGGITGLALAGPVAQYLLQGLIYPLLGRPNGYAPGYTMTSNLFIVLLAVTIGLLWGLAAWRQRGRLAMLGVVWAVLGIAPAFIGLRYSYVSLAPRLLYAAAPGVALLWVGSLWPESSAGHGRRLWRFSGPLLLLLIAWQSSRLLLNFRQLYRVGIEHLGETVATIGYDDGRYLFLNFPDRYEPKRPPYPLGYWGVTLAPVVVDLGDFPTVLTGASPQTLSRSMPWVDTEARANGPYNVDMRGVIIQPDELYALAATQDAVYLSRYLPDGRFALQLAGALESQGAPSCRLALFDETICLQAVAVTEANETLHVQLSWSTLAAILPHVTIFTHLGRPGQPPLVQSDGDAWRGALPLADWQPGDLIHEQRTLPRPAGNGVMALQIGLYNWVSGERLPAVDLEGRPLPANAYTQTIEP